MPVEDQIARRLDPARAAVIVIDVQNDYCALNGVVGSGTTGSRSTDQIVDNIIELTEVAREIGVPVVMTQMVSSEEVDSVAWSSRRPNRPPGRPSACRQGDRGADPYRLYPESGDVKLIKHRYSAFVGTDLQAELRRLGRDSLLLCGFSTDVCVETTLRDAVCRDFYATLIEDCCGASSSERHARAIEAVRSDFGLVTSFVDIVEYWRDQTR